MTTERDTLRVFYAPREKTPQKAHEDRLAARVAELEAETDRLTRDLSERTQELLEALDALERAGVDV